jgi:hypothetical protein
MGQCCLAQYDTPFLQERIIVQLKDERVLWPYGMLWPYGLQQTQLRMGHPSYTTSETLDVSLKNTVLVVSRQLCTN